MCRSTIYRLVVCASLLSSFWDVYAARVQNGLNPESNVIPSVVHGQCQMCGTSSCVNCRKCSAKACVRDRIDDDEQPRCNSCSNNSFFCAQRNEDASLSRGCKTESLFRCCLGCEAPSSVFIPRSVGADTARELAGWEEYIYQYDVGDYYLVTGHVLGYSHSFHSERIARSLFGSCELHFAGSQVADRSRCALLADNFGLSTHFKGSLRIHPKIENIYFDNQFFIGLDPWICGLYARIHAPIVHTRWSLGLSQKIHEQECTEFPACYMSENPTPASCNILQALSGNFTFGDMQQPWKFGRFVCGTQTKTGLADIDLIVGYNCWQNDSYHFGFYGQLVAPTGTKFKAHTVFEPIIGTTRHWELGLGLSSHLVLWQRDADQSFAVYVEGNMTHLFKNRQMRSFDFCANGLLSRYMLLKELVLVGDTLQYNGNLINGINFATRPVHVSVGLKGDVSAKLSYRSPCFIVDLGYNFYGIMKEHIEFIDCKNDKLFGIKGTEGVCALEYETVGTQPPLQFGPLVEKISLNATQRAATIHKPGPTDNPQEISLISPSNIAVTALSRQQGIIEGPDVIKAFSSNPPILVTASNLHKESGTMPAQATHKVFGYLGYDFYDWDRCYCPYLGLGGELEFDFRACTERSALNQWSIWVKGGFEF